MSTAAVGKREVCADNTQLNPPYGKLISSLCTLEGERRRSGGEGIKRRENITFCVKNQQKLIWKTNHIDHINCFGINVCECVCECVGLSV